jgi:hypothetical protein
MFLRSILRASPWTVMAIAMEGSAMAGAHAAEAATGSAPASKAANPVAAGGIVLAQRGPGGGGGGGRAIGGGGGGPRAGGGPRMGPSAGPGYRPRPGYGRPLATGQLPDTDPCLDIAHVRAIDQVPGIPPVWQTATRLSLGVSRTALLERRPLVLLGTVDRHVHLLRQLRGLLSPLPRGRLEPGVLP